ncbi:hypothetical protein RRG08_011623 [Elysia crispata]|uniref:Uncharacterized protein n=1 Tax=Elysia crispata TaxID=231223 RepID=A0AAE0XP23_9GAST|nr:hypothetical protein RRG08_011623 [Elysia crispata]
MSRDSGIWTRDFLQRMKLKRITLYVYIISATSLAMGRYPKALLNYDRNATMVYMEETATTVLYASEMGACPRVVNLALVTIPAIISMVLVTAAVTQATKVLHVHKFYPET